MSVTAGSSTSSALRLKLESRTMPGKIDGFWWPHSRDLYAEATQLVDEFPKVLGRVTRILFSAPDWDNELNQQTKRWLQTKNSRIKIGSFPDDDTNLLILRTDRETRLVLLVVPPGSSVADASEHVSQTVLRDGNKIGSDEH